MMHKGILRRRARRTQWSRRAFLRAGAMWAGAAGLGCLGVPAAFASSPPLRHTQAAFLSDMRHVLSGERLHVLAVDSPAVRAAMRITAQEFTARTGAAVQWIIVPPAKAAARMYQDVSTRRGQYDLYCIRDTWLLDAIPHYMDLETVAPPALSYPEGQAAPMFPGLALSVQEHGAFIRPFAAPVRLLVYRHDLFAQLGLAAPITVEAVVRAAKTVTKALAPTVYGIAAPWRTGSVDLVQEAIAWMWAHGGSLFAADGTPLPAQDACTQALEALLDLEPCMPPEATTWDDTACALAVAEGRAAMGFIRSDLFPLLDAPELTQQAGAVLPLAMVAMGSLHPPDQCGFGERPGMHMKFGSHVGISRYSRAKDAAWVFLQWLTDQETALRLALMGGGSYVCPACLAHSLVEQRSAPGPETTRHFSTVQRAMADGLGILPLMPGWQQMVSGPLATALGKMAVGIVSPKATYRVLVEAMSRHVDGGQG